MGNRIEIAKSARSKCVTCGDVIPKGSARLAEEYSDVGIPDLIHRFFHVKCAAAVHPELVANALQHVEVGAVFDRAEIEAKIAPAVQRATEERKQKYLAQVAAREKEAKPVVVADDDTTLELLAQLDGDPEDLGTLAVVADQLQARGDPRGELIALQLATRTGASTLALEGHDDEETDASERTSAAERQAQRIAELIEKLSLDLHAGDRCTWGIGFIQRLELRDKNGTQLSALLPLWKHPSLRFLRELQLTFSSSLDTGFIGRLVDVLPKTLRVLELGDSSHHALAGTTALIAQLPALDRLALTGKLALEALAHPTLRRLELGTATRYGMQDLLTAVPRLSTKTLPAVTELALCGSRTGDELALVVALLAAGGWLKRLTHLSWLHGERALDDDAVKELAKGLGKRKLARLDLTGTKVPLVLRDKLAKLCTELVVPVLEIDYAQTVYVEHVNKPEWGRGKLVKRGEGKLEVEFPKPVGRKVFKADAPFLKLLA